MELRYTRNFHSLSEIDQESIGKKTILVVGNGGLGGYVLDSLARLGVKKIKLIDFDQFDFSNLNRQLISNEKNIGLSKVSESEKYINLVNSSVQVESHYAHFEEVDFKTLFEDLDIVFDCCDNIKTKFNIEEQCKNYNVPMIYGAVAGFFGQVSCILPESNPLLHKIYPHTETLSKGVEVKEGNMCFTVSIISSFQVSLFIKLIQEKEMKKNGFYYIDMDSYELQWIPFK